MPLDLKAAELTLLVCDTRVARGLAATGYNDRRAACERAAATLGVSLLRDAQIDNLSRLTGVELKRARHVITENARVLAATVALEANDFVELGRLMYESHQSLRDDYEVSSPELDAFVEVAKGFDALGARLTGAGFGGCAIALVDGDEVPALEAGVRQRFSTRGFKPPAFYAILPCTGAEVVIG